jgi:high affinity Mn2+ porin
MARTAAKRGVSIAGIAAVTVSLAMPTLGADVLPLRMSLKAPSNANFDWTGFYVGAHLGYATGYSNWSATPIGAAGPGLAGSLDFFRTYDGFKGTGSYFAGLQAGYTYMLPSRVVLGIETDVSFPNLIGGQQVFTSPATGTASYAETMQYFGTVRGRIGYAPAHWMIYATGGFAWTYEQFTRTQISGMPAGGTAVADTVEDLFIVPRIGWTLGAGGEVALPSNWSARVEYLYTDYGSRSVSFPQGAQRFTSDLVTQSVRLGFNYRPGAAAANGDFIAKGPPALEYENFVLHGQTTVLGQYAFPFRVPYRGPNSLDPNQLRETWDVTFYAGLRLWEGAELWINPEIDQGFGLSSTLGVAGFPSGEAYKVGFSVPYARIPRMFVRQTIDLGGEKEKVDANINQFAGSRTTDRLVITVGKFGATDIFDANKYAHDPRTDFFNWSLVDTGTWDYAADAWGYTWGAAIEWYKGNWTLRGGVFDLSITPNNTQLDPRFQQFQWIGEIEHRHQLWGQPGKIAVTGFLTRGRMGRFADAIQLAQIEGGPADIAAVRRYASRGGVSVNLEQQVASDLGVFARAGWANGDFEPYEFSDIDRTVAAGLALNGKRWGRPDDTFGLAGVVNGITSIHQAFLNAGGLGILVGDGQLPNYGSEKILEMYYSLPFFSWRATFDYQFIANPAYNRDRGPVSVIGTRLRTQF